MTWLPGYIRLFVGKTASPGVGDDINDGHEVGDVWVDETNDTSWQCQDITAGAAVWAQLDLGAGVGSGSVTSVKEDNVLVDDEVVTIDFLGADFDLAEDPAHEIQVIINAAIARVADVVNKTLFDANSILAATADDTPAAVTVAEQTLVGRITAGNIAALNATQIRTLLNVADGADVTASNETSHADVVVDADFAANVAAFLADPTSAKLITAVTDETGTGALVFATSPTLVTPALGTPASGVLSGCSDYPLSALTGAATLISLEGITIAAGTLVYGTAADTVAALAAGATTTILVGGGAAAPVWTTVTGTGAPVKATSPTLVTPNIGAATLGGTFTVGENGILLDPVLSADNKYSGVTTSGLIGYASPDLGDLVYLDDTVDRWEKTDANAVGTAGNVQLGLVVSPDGSGSDGDACVILLYGYMKETDFNFTAQGNALYVSETAGLITDTAPATASAMVRVVGYAGADADTVFFNPSGSWVEIAA